MTEAERRIAERYPVRRRPWLVPLLVVALGSLVAYWLWISAGKANPPLQGNVSSFQVVSDTETRVKVMVDRRTPATSGRCLVYVQAVDFERVGEVSVPIGPADRKTDERWVSVRTFRRGTSASVDHCG
ncbi:DUF4307 domain-containing protein [Mariniluteicoccus flavus]